ncbi:MAG TPA: FAD-dependent oxidoreductase [Mycobacterium sp.]|nr:FAD-dependent oxidoreductase [Mycobacterium sp.]
MTTTPPASPAAPVFSDEQWKRLRGFGTPQVVSPGTWLFRAGEATCDMILVENGAIDILAAGSTDNPETVVAHYGSRQFSGELNLLTGQATYFEARAATAATIYRISPTDFRRLMASEPDLSDLILRALVARRQRLCASRVIRGVQLVAGTPSSRGLALRTYLDRQQLPYTVTKYDSEIGKRVARGGDLHVEDLPAVLVADTVIRQATPARVADVLGLGYRPVSGQTLDVVVIGGGPAGLAAAVYGASEGLQTLLIDAVAAGGQAAASSRIENYLGFTSGLSGADLTGRAVIQAHKFGAQIASPVRAAGVDTTPGHLRVLLDDATAIDTRAIVVATGAHYRRLPLARWSDFEGTGVYYAATELEARRCGADPVAVVGGANSAGQAALFLARRGHAVNMVVRGDSLTDRMSAYLADRIVTHPGIAVHTRTEITALNGDDQLRRITTTTTTGDGRTTETDWPCCGLFCFAGAVPATDWLTGVAVDEHGFVLTDAMLADCALGDEWSELNRRPLPFETNKPGILAAGDVRAGSMKRVAAAVGEGASAMSSVHTVLAQLHR